MSRLILELVGPPGAGKTELAAALAARLNGGVSSISSRKEWAWYLARYGLWAPLDFLSLLGATLRENWRHPRLLRYKFGLLAGALARTSLARSEGRRGIVLIDEGLAQYALALPERDLEQGEMSDYFRRYVSCDALILIQAGAGTRRARMAKRGRIPRSQYGVDQKEWQETVERNARRIADVPNLVSRLTVASDDAGPDALAREIVERLRERGLHGS